MDVLGEHERISEVVLTAQTSHSHSHVTHSKSGEYLKIPKRPNQGSQCERKKI